MFSSTRFVFARAAVPSVPKRDFTRATLLGRVGNEPELRNFENGTKVVSFNLAVDRTSPNWKSMTPEQRKKNTMWFRVYFFENPFLTKIVDEKVTKGSLVLVDGELTQRTITTKTGFESTITDLSLGNGIFFLRCQFVFSWLVGARLTKKKKNKKNRRWSHPCPSNPCKRQSCQS
jgi:single stranded DNA-binding protein